MDHILSMSRGKVVMRPIKFRAWDKKNRTMVDVRTIDFDETGNVEEINTSTYCWSNRFDPPSLSGVALMQNTGLKDQKGKEIYEGDIVRLHDGDEFFAAISWDERHAGWSWDELSLFEILQGPPKAEIVGNVYENSELLDEIQLSKSDSAL